MRMSVNGWRRSSRHKRTTRGAITDESNSCALVDDDAVVPVRRVHLLALEIVETRNARPPPCIEQTAGAVPLQHADLDKRANEKAHLIKMSHWSSKVLPSGPLTLRCQTPFSSSHVAAVT